MQAETIDLAGLIETLPFRPLGEVLLVFEIEKDDKTEAGLFIPETAQRRSCRGVVVRIGPGLWKDGTFVETSLRPGDRIVFGRYVGTEIVINGTEFLVMKESEVYGTEPILVEFAEDFIKAKAEAKEGGEEISEEEFKKRTQGK